MNPYRITHFGKILDFEALAVSTIAVPCTAAKLAKTINGQKFQAFRILISVETNSVRFRVDAVPTATVGHLLIAGDSMILEGVTNIANVNFIRQSADSTVMVSYFYRSLGA